MPVRKIPRNYRNVTGVKASAKANGKGAHFESTLERDFYTLLDFDLNVDTLEPQPVRIEYKDGNGQTRTYTPDVLVVFRDDIAPANEMQPWLCEVKYREDLKKIWPAYKRAYKAAFRYALKRGWRFRFMTEREIRTPYLDNVRFLSQYRNIPDGPENAEFRKLILDMLYEMRETEPESLIVAIYKNKWNQAQLLPVLWHLIATGRVGIDLRLPLTMRGRIWTLDPVPSLEDVIDE